MKPINKRSIRILLLVLFSFGSLLNGCSCLEDDLTSLDIVGAPAFSTAGGTNYDVTLSSSTEGAAIKYTTDLSNPSTSSTAVDGTSLTIDMVMVIKAYAYKDGMKDSSIVEYRVPTFDTKRVIKYNADGSDRGYGSVNYYYEYANDCNGKKVIETYYSGKGDDGKWFTCDDTVNYHIVYTYTAGGEVERETKYSASGSDGEWLTSDDTVEYYYAYTYTSGNLTERRKFDSSDSLLLYITYTYDSGNPNLETMYTSGDAIDYYLDYTYSTYLTRTDKYTGAGLNGEWYTGSDDVLDSYSTYSENLTEETKYDSGDTQNGLIAYSYEDNADYYFTYTYSSGKLSQMNKYLQYGTDTFDYHCTYIFDDDNLQKETKYKDDNSGDVDYYFLYTYENDKLTKKEKYNSDDTLDYYYTYIYDGDHIEKEIKYIKPDANTQTVSWNITVSSSADDGGYYTVSGVNYDTSGDPIGTIADGVPDNSESLKLWVEKIKAIANNTSYTDTGTTINGLRGGYCKITTAVDISGGTASAKFKFSNYDDGDVKITGTITKAIAGSISLSGSSISGTFTGTFTGSVTITDSNPSWSESDYIVESYFANEYTGDNNTTKNFYNDPGADGEWLNADDTKNSYASIAYSGADPITETWYDSGATEQYKYTYTYSSGDLVKKVKSMNYGTLLAEMSDSGIDTNWATTANWETTADDTIDYSIFEYEIDDCE
ncbi:MAG: hypothetical protein GY754_12530 [bacterium]|nr:hypothetical protein [bacterium]